MGILSQDSTSGAVKRAAPKGTGKKKVKKKLKKKSFDEFGDLGLFVHTYVGACWPEEELPIERHDICRGQPS